MVIQVIVSVKSNTTHWFSFVECAKTIERFHTNCWMKSMIHLVLLFKTVILITDVYVGSCMFSRYRMAFCISSKLKTMLGVEVSPARICSMVIQRVFRVFLFYGFCDSLLIRCM